MFNIQEELKKLPSQPGVYLMKDKDEQIIYVGKSVSLKNRVRSYFSDVNNKDMKGKALYTHIKSFEYIVTDTEIEALILENNLIKAHRPKYNVLMKDDKTYPYIKVTINEKFPRVISVRSVKNDKAKYYGPYTSSFLINETLDIIHKLWKIRTCKKNFPRDLNKGRPCLNHHIGKCTGPCNSSINEENYNSLISEVIGFLESKREDLVKIYTQQMVQASENLDYELAAKIRDRLAAINGIKQQQNIDNISVDDHDVIAQAKQGNDALVQIFFIRNGKMTGRETIFMEGVKLMNQSEIITAFLKQFYSDTSFVPKEILLENDIEEKDIISEYLTSIRGSKVKILIPVRGAKQKLVKLASNNAKLSLEQFGEGIKRQKAKTDGAAADIAKALGLDITLNRIEAYDISNVQGYESVGSMVVFEGGKPKKSDYRKFRIKTVIGANDYASMEEVIERRFKRYLEENDSFTKLPDIIFVDGGRGQVNSAQKALKKLGISVPICGMVKDDYHKTRGLFFNNEEIIIDKKSESFKLIIRIQDEAHRFALEYHRKLRKTETLQSVIDEIEGIGTARKSALFKKFKTIDGIKNATLEELELTDTITKKNAKDIYQFFNEGESL